MTETRDGSLPGKKTVSKKIVTPLAIRCMTNRFASSSAGISNPRVPVEGEGARHVGDDEADHRDLGAAWNEPSPTG